MYLLIISFDYILWLYIRWLYIRPKHTILTLFSVSFLTYHLFYVSYHLYPSQILPLPSHCLSQIKGIASVSIDSSALAPTQLSLSLAIPTVVHATRTLYEKKLSNSSILSKTNSSCEDGSLTEQEGSIKDMRDRDRDKEWERSSPVEEPGTGIQRYVSDYIVYIVYVVYIVYIMHL